ncbi:MAG: S-layer homology domain-containing protein, partial [Firmicutes bacterium]|nr:S-layer homology domain-containing protein [Bacillota bacterium]
MAAFAASDTAGTAYETAVDALIEKEYASGYPDGTFRPEHQISRAEAASIIVKFTGVTAEDL